MGSGSSRVTCYENVTHPDCATYCNYAEYTMREDECKNLWCTTYPSDCYNTIVRLYGAGSEQVSTFCKDPRYKSTCLFNCNNNFDPTICKQVCLDNQGQCDSGAKDYCYNNPSDPFCRCIKSNLVKFEYNPLCTDQDCIQDGYQTSSMVSAKGGGCQIVDCRTQFDIQAEGSVKFNNVNIEQNCGNSGTSSSPLTKKNIIIGIIILIMSIILIIGIVLIII